MRPSGRALDEMRKLTITRDVNAHAEGSCMIELGDTRLICTASVDESVPSFLRKSGLGWVTAEYGMLPRSTHERMRREAVTGRQSGRSQEISRLIGRSLRAGVDRSVLGERQITIDCDVIQADGGTRCAAITGGWVALRIALDGLLRAGMIERDPMVLQISAISVGLYAGQEVLDLDYAEDSDAGADANIVLGTGGKLVELQATAEGSVFDRAQISRLLDLAEKGAGELFAAQLSAAKAAS